MSQKLTDTDKSSTIKTKMVIVIRSDLGMSAGKIAAQAAHSAVKAGLDAYITSGKLNPRWKEWNSNGCAKVILKVENEEQLKAIIGRSKLHELSVFPIVDAGLTELPENTLTCCAIGPDEESKIDKITGQLPLF